MNTELTRETMVLATSVNSLYHPDNGFSVEKLPEWLYQNMITGAILGNWVPEIKGKYLLEKLKQYALRQRSQYLVLFDEISKDDAVKLNLKPGIYLLLSAEPFDISFVYQKQIE